MLAADPTVTDWMQGWGSIAGVIMAALAALFTGLLLRHEARVRREDKLDAEMAQARLVVAEVRVGNSHAAQEAARQSEPPSYSLFGLTNHSASPIFEVTVLVETRDRRLLNSFARLTVGPGEAVFEGFYPSGAGLDEVSAVVRFTDAQGLAWERVRTGIGSYMRRRGQGIGPALEFIDQLARDSAEARNREAKARERRKPRRPLDPPP